MRTRGFKKKISAHVIEEPKEYSFQRAGIQGKIFPTQSLTEKTEYFLVETDNGHETTIIKHVCDFIYYILNGEGYFVVDGSRENCSEGDLVVIPAEKPFTYKGRLKMIATSTLPWRQKQEETLS